MISVSVGMLIICALAITINSLYCKHRYNVKKDFKVVGNNINDMTGATVAMEHMNSSEKRSEVYNAAYISTSGSDTLDANMNSPGKRIEEYNAAYISTSGAVTLGSSNISNTQVGAHGNIKMNTNPAYGNVATIKMNNNPAYETAKI